MEGKKQERYSLMGPGRRRYMLKTISVQGTEGITSCWIRFLRTIRTGMKNAA